MSSAAAARVEDVDYSDARVREQTFRIWPLTRPGITDMAEAGFIYKGSGDTVECYACGVVLSGWSEGDRAKQRHQREAPDCPLTELFRDDNDDDIASHASGATGVSGAADPAVGKADPAQADTVKVDRIPRTGERNPSDLATTVNLLNPKALYADPIPQSARYKKLEERMKSFEGIDWPHDLEAQPDQLAKAGFFYQGPGDKVKCGYCGGKIKNWTATQHAIEEHIRHFPKCTFVANIQQTANSKSAKCAMKQAQTQGSEGSVGSSSPHTDVSSKEQLPVAGHVDPSDLGYATMPDKKYKRFAERLQSFDGWRGQLKPEQLARAGFYYTGTGDTVCCMSCGRRLKNWASDDCPFAQHLRYSPECKYMKKLKETGVLHQLLHAGSSGSSSSGVQAEARPLHEEVLLKMKKKRCDILPAEREVRMQSDCEPTLPAILAVTQRKEKERYMRSSDSSDESGNEEDSAPTIEEQRSELQQRIEQTKRERDEKREVITCKICRDEAVDVVFLPCRHLACRSCAPRLQDCPMCRSPIMEKMAIAR